MRPPLLNALFTDVLRLKGVGEQVKKALLRLLPRRAQFANVSSHHLIVRDLVYHLPIGVINRRNAPPLMEAVPDTVITADVVVEAHYPPQARRAGKKPAPYKILVSNETGSMMLIFFHQKGDYLKTLLPVGEQRIVSGKVERQDGILHMPHPDYVTRLSERAHVQQVEPVYPLTHALSNRQIRKLMQQALASLPLLPEWADTALLSEKKWQPWQESLVAAHHPNAQENLLPADHARERLAYDELLAHQLAIAILRRRIRKIAGPVIADNNLLREKLLATLPFELTQGQRQVLQEIDADMASGNRMLRLLQGDVGSGKTVVALLAMLRAVEAGYQCALMVPTEIVASQHLAFVQKNCAALNIGIVLLTGNVQGGKRTEILDQIQNGSAKIIIGTQALFQEHVQFHNLGLIVIDEQHRFGVKQRLALSAKGSNPHILLMTATPIPRSLTLTQYGDMDSSLLREKPVGRKPIDTRAIPLSRVEAVIEGLARALDAGSKIYWICPLIEEAELEEGSTAFSPDLAAAEERYREFRHRFGARAGLLHGRMKQAEREAAMHAFAEGECAILVATTVVEVGVNVPEATVMIIEHAERFGLSQLHQLRGRVGRSDAASSCLLLYADRAGETAIARLKALRETEDGFRIAEQDLYLRGGGDILGTRQSGLPEFYVADILLHAELLATAHKDAQLALSKDAALTSARGQALRHLLYLFGYDENIRYIASG